MAQIGRFFRKAALLTAMSLLVLYRWLVSPLLVWMLGPACRFQPTCSQYAQQAISEYGLLRGGVMALRRILRCRPGGGFGYDPVPSNPAPPANPNILIKDRVG
jgi:putative membrane protein insertion efficiency factor